MDSIIANANRDIVPIIESLGYEVVDVEYKSYHKKMHLTFFIHKEGGVSLDDCQKVNDALDKPLEEFDITNGRAYILNISSPGLDRPIKSDDDLRRNLNTDVEINVIEKVDKKQKLVGQLSSYDSTSITIKIGEQLVLIDRTNIKLLVPHIKF